VDDFAAVDEDDARCGVTAITNGDMNEMTKIAANVILVIMTSGDRFDGAGFSFDVNNDDEEGTMKSERKKL